MTFENVFISHTIFACEAIGHAVPTEAYCFDML